MDFKQIDKALNEAQDEGMQAFVDGLSKYINPYEVGSLSFDAWAGGWLIAKEDYGEIKDSECPLRPEDFEPNY